VSGYGVKIVTFWIGNRSLEDEMTVFGKINRMGYKKLVG
jgi:hypothetical protein